MKLENYLSQSGTDFLSRSESGGFENLTESRHGICESAVWVYFQDYHKYWLDGGDPEYTEELCMNDLALMIIVGDHDIDPRDITFGLDSILNRANRMSHDKVRSCCNRAAGIARRYKFENLATRMETYPDLVWAGSTYKARMPKSEE